MTAAIPVLASVGAALVLASDFGTYSGGPRRIVAPRSAAAGSPPELAARLGTKRTWVWSRWCVAGAVALWLIGPFGLAGIVVGVVGFRRTRIIAIQRSEQRRIERDLPEALDLFVLLLDAGVSSRGAVSEMARRGPASTRPGFAHVDGQLDIGKPFVDAIVTLRSDLGSGAVALVELLIASHRHGLAMTQVIAQLSTEARAARRRRNEGQARALPIKLSFPLVVCTLPSFVLLAIVPAVMAALSSLGAPAW